MKKNLLTFATLVVSVIAGICLVTNTSAQTQENFLISSNSILQMAK